MAETVWAKRLSIVRQMSVAFRSAKVAFWRSFAERKATMKIRTMLMCSVLRFGGELSQSNLSRAPATDVSPFNQITTIGVSACNDGPWVGWVRSGVTARMSTEAPQMPRLVRPAECNLGIDRLFRFSGGLSCRRPGGVFGGGFGWGGGSRRSPDPFAAVSRGLARCRSRPLAQLAVGMRVFVSVA